MIKKWCCFIGTFLRLFIAQLRYYIRIYACMRVCRPSKKAPPRLSNATGLSWVSLLSALDDRGRSPLAWAFGSRCRSEHVTIFCSWDWSHHWIVDPFVPHFDFAPRIRAETIQSSRLLSTHKIRQKVCYMWVF